jgi:hypothetical protein
MKKVFILITLLLATSAFSQTPIELGKFGTVYNDSIYCGGTAIGDSVYEFSLDFECEWMKVFIEGDANSPVDSIIFQEGSRKYSNLTQHESGGVNPVMWGSYCTFKDSALNTVNVLVNNTVGKSWTLWNPPMSDYKIYFANHWGTLPTRNATFSIIVKKAPK